jgi:hypothetical protein
MIIDNHVHVYESGRGGGRGAAASVDDLLHEMDAAGVDVSVVIPLPGVASNEYVGAQCARHRDRLVQLYTPEFDRPAQTLGRMRAFCAASDVRGVKIHPRVQGVTIRDPLVREAVVCATELGLPVVFDVFPFHASLDDPATQALAYHRLAQEFPQATLVLAHCGGFQVMDAFMVAKVNRNVLVDVSFTWIYFRGSSIARDLAFICGRLPAGKVLYGSDFPDVSLAEYLELVRRDTEGLGAEQREALFSGAASALYRIGRRGDA